MRAEKAPISASAPRSTTSPNSYRPRLSTRDTGVRRRSATFRMCTRTKRTARSHASLAKATE
eukprot:scaffold139156_cov244-Phaeocystis_antarctica.AAC.1